MIATAIGDCLLPRPRAQYFSSAPASREVDTEGISERNERGSLIVTSNLPFGEWGKVFPDPRLAKAVVDRITHRAHIIETGSESWRFRHRLERSGRSLGVRRESEPT